MAEAADDFTEIEREIKSQPLIGAKEPFAVLRKQYEEHAVFTKKLEGLVGTHEFRRSIRGDGHCFYRSLIFGFLEHYVSTDDIAGIQAMRKNADAKNKYLVEVLKMPWTLGDFHEAFIELCDIAIVAIKSRTANSNPLDLIMQHIRDHDGYIVAFMRYMATAEVKKKEQSYKQLVPNEDVNTFVKERIEAIKSEVDSVAVMAVSRAMALPFRIYYLDQTKGDIRNYNFPHNKTPLIHLLYRPGHYDLIYEKAAAASTLPEGPEEK